MAEIEPIEYNDPQDALVREYLSATLDGQAGRAEARFRQFLAEQEPVPVRNHLFRGPHRFRGWTFGLVGAALAASLAALWAGPSLRPITPPGPGAAAPPIVATPVSEPLLVEQDVQSQTFDDGTFMADDQTPVRVLRRRDFQRTRWFDQNRKLQGEQIVPQEHVVYVQMRTD
jgi:hypothetical protein